MGEAQHPVVSAVAGKPPNADGSIFSAAFTWFLSAQPFCILYFKVCIFAELDLLTFTLYSILCYNHIKKSCYINKIKFKYAFCIAMVTAISKGY